MQNIKTIIDNHNMKVLHQNNKIKDRCNCRDKIFITKYSLSGKNHFIPTQLHTQKSLFWSCIKFVQKKKSAIIPNHKDYANKTKLLKEYWESKMSNFIPHVSWSIVRECSLYNLRYRKCSLCLNEKLEKNI